MIKPNITRRFFLWVVDSWNLVMNVRYNPLKYIPDPSLQGYFMLVLFTMWSAFFGFLCTFYLGWLGYSIVTSIFVHAAVLIPILITNAVFVDAERDGHRWLQDWRREQKGYKIFLQSTRSGVRILWDIDKEA